MVSENTFIIIKPDAVRRGLVGEIISRFEKKGFLLDGLTLRHLDIDWCKKQYGHLNGEIFNNNAAHMISGPVIGIILQGFKAITVVRQMVGCTDSTKALLGTIRGDFGTLPICENLIHASDSPKAVEREIELFYPGVV